MQKMAFNSKVFNDAIHGSIELHPLCVKIIDTPQFQRLRFIKQLGLAYFVYPTASHNRFEHSIGVCYVAGQFVCALRDRQPKLQITDKDVLCVELAGLCHDLGHGPFSHLWEQFMKRMRPHFCWKHEKASVGMLEYLIKVNHLDDEMYKYGLDPVDLTFIKEMIVKPSGAESVSTMWPYKGRSREKGFLYQIVANDENGVDVDKWDYVFRDVHSLGFQVTFNYFRLVKFSRVINISKSSVPDLRICYRDKEMTTIYDMFHARMTLHQKAYQHRVVKTMETMLLDAFILANAHITYPGENGKELPLSEVIDDFGAMTYLNDDIVYRIYRSVSRDEDMTKARRIVHNIMTRQCYPYIGHTVPTTNDIKSEDLLQKMIDNLPPGSHLTGQDLDTHLVTLSYGNGKGNPIQKVGFFSKDEPNVYKEHRPGELSKMLPSEWEEKIFRVVCRSYDPDLLEEAKASFSKACDDLRIPKPCRKPWPNILTSQKT